MIDVSKLYRNSKHNFMFSKLFPENRAVLRDTWKNIEEYERPQKTI